MEENNHKKEMHKWHGDFIPWFGQCLLHVVVTSFGQGLHSTLSSDPKIKLEYHNFLPYIKFSLCEKSPQVGVSNALHSWSQINKRVRRIRNTHKRQNRNNTHTSREKSTRDTQQSYSPKHVLESLSSKAIAWLQVLGAVECSKNAWCLLHGS
jgi:hypothetical protein